MKPCLLLLSVILLAGTASAADEPGLIGPADCQVVNPHPVENERISWTGGCKDGYAQGNGVLIWYLKDQETLRFEGGLRRGQPDGQGYSSDLYGNQYEGRYALGNKEGKGVWMENDGTRYEGEFKADNFDGDGSIVYPEGGRYVGQWKNGKFHGKGKAVYIGGQIVEGEFVDGVPAGQATPPASREQVRYVLKDLRGNRVKAQQTIVGTGIPFDKSYPSMSPAQQQAVRNQYMLLHERDEPPFPLIGLALILDKLANIEMPDERRGRVNLRLRIGIDGKPSSYIVVSSPSRALADAITSVLKNEKFKPGRCDGRPCPMLYKFSVRVD